MNRILGLAFVIYLIGDPGLSMLNSLSVSADYVVAAVVALITIPWVTAQLEN